MGRKPLELTKEGKWLFCPPPSIQCISLAEIIRHEGRALHKFNYKVSVSYPPAIEQVVRRKGRNWRCWIHINLWGKLLKGLVAFLCKMQRLCSYKSGENLTNTNRNNKVKKLLKLPSFKYMYTICSLILSKQIGWMKRRKSPKLIDSSYFSGGRTLMTRPTLAASTAAWASTRCIVVKYLGSWIIKVVFDTSYGTGWPITSAAIFCCHSF